MQKDEIDLALELGHQRHLARAQCSRELEKAIRPMRRQAMLVDGLDGARADDAEFATGVLEKVDLGTALSDESVDRVRTERAKSRRREDRARRRVECRRGA